MGKKGSAVFHGGDFAETNQPSNLYSSTPLLTNQDTQGNLQCLDDHEGTAMKILIGTLLSICVLSVFVASARAAEPFNIGDMLCTELTVLQLEDPNRVTEIMAWLDGYYGANGNDLIYDPAEDEGHKKKILTYCKEHPLAYVMQAASKYFH
jgi:hypothetical protein